MSNNDEKCDHLRELLAVEISVIRKHLDRHKWFRHIPNETEGMKDFIKQYGWLMRELYCGYICEKRNTCQLHKDFPLDKTEDC